MELSKELIGLIINGVGVILWYFVVNMIKDSRAKSEISTQSMLSLEKDMTQFRFSMEKEILEMKFMFKEIESKYKSNTMAIKELGEKVKELENKVN